jgi:hypothetical protein
VALLTLVSVVVVVASPNYYVFITSVTYTGDLGGIEGADAKCNIVAAGSSIPTVASITDWRAWISNSTLNATDHIVLTATENYTLVNGTVIAMGASGLLNGTLENQINVNENGDPVTTGALGRPTAWTGTNALGSLEMPIYTCQDWTTSSPTERGYVGDAAEVNYGLIGFFWTRAVTTSCSTSGVGLYCFSAIPV